MRKIPTLFRRDREDLKTVTPLVTPGCEWVLAGEGAPTRKFDGTCVMFDGVDWWARRVVKFGKAMPDRFQALESDPVTEKWVGWEPIEQSSFAKWHAAALEAADPLPGYWEIGTYELCGPKINGNPDRFDTHVLRLHAAADPLVIRDDELTFEGLRTVCRRLLEVSHIEGIVWHHPDGRMAKLKGRDFPAVRS